MSGERLRHAEGSEPSGCKATATEAGESRSTLAWKQRDGSFITETQGAYYRANVQTALPLDNSARYLVVRFPHWIAGMVTDPNQSTVHACVVGAGL